MLEAPFSEEEVLFALSARSGDKAPDPNGFSMAFWQASWDFLKGEKRGAENLRDFKPISLVSSLFKLLAKVLANGLKKVLFAKEGQSGGFLPGWFGERKRERGDGCFSFTVFQSHISVLKERASPSGEGGEYKGVGSRVWMQGWGVSIHLSRPPLGALFKSMVVWDSVEERFQKRLALWKGWYISKEGGETYPNSQHSVQLAYLFNVLILYAKISWAKVGVNSKRLPLERRGPLEETSLG
ncbi:hypothetical protein CK203_108376 [Vitis vinifera]|uniref:Uncharacterized protein n=1 Tax=Vitis vinifera TaxID=29760 RepID=A0A438CU62_VITVI|nr:hypothetical protein CK203_108376 [Vitis vinifera]